MSGTATAARELLTHLENACTRQLGEMFEPLALRADHLALGRSGDVFVLHELDATGRLLEASTFELGDRAGALRELDRRNLASPETPPIVHAVDGWTRAFNERDWDGFDEVLAEDLLVVDHRPVPIGDRHNRAELKASVGVGVELVPDMFVFVIRDFALSNDVACGLLSVDGNAEHGGPIEWEYVAVTSMRGDGQIHLFEEFDVEDTDKALARFEELTRP